MPNCRPNTVHVFMCVESVNVVYSYAAMYLLGSFVIRVMIVVYLIVCRVNIKDCFRYVSC